MSETDVMAYRRVLHELRSCHAPGCNDGIWTDGIKCSVCNGTGIVDWSLGDLSVGSRIASPAVVEAIDLALNGNKANSEWIEARRRVRAWLEEGR